MNKEAKPLTQEQRKEFVQLLKDAKTRVIETLTEWRINARRRDKARNDAFLAIAKEAGSSEVVDKALNLRKELKQMEKSLQTAGFKLDGDGDLVFTDEGHRRYDDDLEDRISQILSDQVETIRKGYERAILNVLATESVEEAKGIVEPLV